jgi:hypothetical protein
LSPLVGSLFGLSKLIARNRGSSERTKAGFWHHLRFLALVLILSGVGYLQITVMSERARRIIADLTCDSNFEPIAAGR